MRILVALIVGMLFTACPVQAQEDGYFSSTTSALQNVLTSLKQSVEKLNLDNDQLAAKDEDIKQHILQLQGQLGQLQSQWDALKKSTAQAQGQNPALDQKIKRLEDEDADLDNRTQQAQNSIKSIQQSLDGGHGENEAHVTQDDVQRQKEVMKLKGMIYNSQQQQGSLQESILEYQKNTPLLPASSALVRQQLLKERIKDLEGQMAGYSTEGVSGDKTQWDTAQLGELESMLENLENNYTQLKSLTQQMSKKNLDSRMTVSQHVEEEKLQGSMYDLGRQGEGLRADLDSLRSQMIDLDKRKSQLELMIKRLS